MMISSQPKPISAMEPTSTREPWLLSSTTKSQHQWSQATDWPKRTSTSPRPSSLASSNSSSSRCSNCLFAKLLSSQTFHHASPPCPPRLSTKEVKPSRLREPQWSQIKWLISIHSTTSRNSPTTTGRTSRRRSTSNMSKSLRMLVMMLWRS